MLCFTVRRDRSNFHGVERGIAVHMRKFGSPVVRLGTSRLNENNRRVWTFVGLDKLFPPAVIEPCVQQHGDRETSGPSRIMVATTFTVTPRNGSEPQTYLKRPRNGVGTSALVDLDTSGPMIEGYGKWEELAGVVKDIKSAVGNTSRGKRFIHSLIEMEARSAVKVFPTGSPAFVLYWDPDTLEGLRIYTVEEWEGFSDQWAEDAARAEEEACQAKSEAQSDVEASEAEGETEPAPEAQ